MGEYQEAMNLTPEQRIKYELILTAEANGASKGIGEPTPEKIEAEYERLSEDGAAQDIESDFRGGEVETGLPTQFSQHYESKEVAAKLNDGSWVGWTYWYGGGKHGNPEEIEWMDKAYALDCVEEQKMVTVRTFTKVA